MKKNKPVGRAKSILLAGRKLGGRILTKPEELFGILALVFGVAMIFSMPLFTPPDEPSHFFRAYQVSRGVVLGETVKGKTGGQIPAFSGTESCKELSRERSCVDSNQKVDLQKTSFVSFSASVYSPITYIPQVVGILIAQVIYPSTHLMVIMGRLFNLIAYIGMFYFAIKSVKHGKWVYVVIGLFPVAIQQAASLSGDVMTIGLSVIWIALVSNLYVTSTVIGKKQLVYLVLLAAGLVLTKQTNAILLLGLLFLPKSNFGSNRRKLVQIGLIFALAALIGVVWYMMLNSINYNYNSPVPSETLIDKTAQLHSILHNPQTFVVALVHEYIYEGFHAIGGVSPDFLIISMHSFFSGFTYKLPLLFCILGYLGLIIALLYSGEKDEQQKNTKALRRVAFIYAAQFVLLLVAIAGVMYLTWTPVGSKVIYGVQGRYFIPLIPLLIPLFVLVRKYIRVNLQGRYTAGIIFGTISAINLLTTVILTIKFFSL